MDQKGEHLFALTGYNASGCFIKELELGERTIARTKLKKKKKKKISPFIIS